MQSLERRSLFDINPAAPSGLAATAVVDDQFTLSWTDNSNDETAFQVEALYSGFDNYRVVASVSPNTTSVDFDSVSGQDASYRVRALKSGGSSYSESLNAGANPHAPSGIEAEINSSGDVEVSWSDNSSDETAFSVYRSYSLGTPYYIYNEWQATPDETALTIPRSQIIWPDNAWDTSYVEVNAYRDNDAPTYAGGTKVEIHPAAGGLDAPESITVVYDGANEEFDFSWDAVVGADYYRVFDCDLEYPQVIAETSGTSASVFFGNLAYNHHIFTVQAITRDGGGNLAQWSHFSPPSARFPVSVAAPSSLTAAASGSESQATIGLAWNNNSGNEEAFVVETSIDGGTTFSNSKTLGEDLSSIAYSLPWLQGKTYKFRVKATHQSVSSPYSNTASVLLDRQARLCGGQIGANGQTAVSQPTVSSLTGDWSEVPGLGNGGTQTGSQFLAKIDDDALTVVYAPGQQIFFDLVSGKYVEAFGGNQTLVHKGSQYVLTDASGNQTFFDDSFVSTPIGEVSYVTSRKTAGGITAQVTDADSEGKPVEVVLGDANSVQTEMWTYGYETSGPMAGKLLSVVQAVPGTGSTWIALNEITYEYYDGTDASGLPGQLKLAEIKDNSANRLETYYYRYYAEDEAGGFAGAVKFVFSNSSYSRLLEAFNVPSADSLEDEDLAPYADQYLEYDGNQRVSMRTVQGDGCSACTGGAGTYSYEYEFSEHADGANNWRYKTIETLPDGNLNVMYFNHAGQVMLSAFVDTTTNQKWATFHKYDANGREILTASPAAVALPSSFTTIEAYADLLNEVSGNYQYLSDSAGQISVTDYYGSTTATESAAGGVDGYEQYRKIKNGETGTAILLSSTSYIAHDDDDADTDDTLSGGAGDDVTIYLLDTETQYRNTDSTGDQTTAYDYTWYANSLQAASKTTTNPTVTTAQNGSNSATSSVRYYDAYGRVQWQKDEGGFVTYNEYDGVTGGLVKQIVDVDVSETADFSGLPSGWTTPANGGLHLITEMAVDPLGRTTKVTDPNGNVTYTVYDDANHETRVYRGWNATTGTTTGPIEVTRQDIARGYTERFTMSATPATSGSSGSYVPTGGESISGLQSLTRDVLNAAGQVVHRDVYTTSGLTYSTSVTIGTAGTDYLRTELGYDWRGRQARVKRPDGTWTHTVYDGQGRATSVWKGTDNTGWTQTDPSNGGAGTNNMVKVSSSAYDGGGVGDSNLSESRQVFGSGGSDYYATSYAYDFRGRLTDTRGADGVASKYTYDNLGQQTAVETYADADTDFTINSGERRGKSETAYDNRGQVFQSTVYEVDPATGTSPGTVRDGLSTDYWYGARGNLIKTMDGSGRFDKNIYDGAGRLIQTSVSAQPSEITSGTYADADDITGDLVVMSTEYWLDKSGRTRLETLWRRPNDLADSVTGTPTVDDFEHSATGYWFDAADRIVAIADFGRDGEEQGAVSTDRLVWASSGHAYIDTDADGIPNVIDGAQDASPGLDNFSAATDTAYRWIYTGYAYDPAGRLQDLTDNANRVTRTLYDLAGRKTSVIENYVNGTVANAEYDSDRTTQYAYDPQGRLWKQIAKSPNGSGVDDQVTTHLYASDIDRSWMSYTLYPDSGDAYTTSGGMATITSGSDHTSSTYDRLGRTLTSTDQRGVVHTYTYDSAGRLLTDSIGTGSLPGGVDGAVRSIAYTYDDLSRVETVSSKSVSGSVLNQVQYEYDTWGNVTKTYQAHDGAVNTSSTPYIRYIYEDGAVSGVAKYVRLKDVLYPTNNGSTVGAFRWQYSTTTTGAAVNRLSALRDVALNTLVQYQYLGEKLDRQILHPQISGGLMLNNGTESSGYGGWDRFYRQKKVQWQNTAGTTNFEQRVYTYDRAGNRLAMDSSSTGGGTDWDESYAYDGLNRLIDFKRGTLASAVISGANLKFQQTWSLDALGNWKSFTEDADGNGGGSAVTQSRSTNAVNEITGYTANPESWAAPAYDASGNMTTAPKGQGSESTAQSLIYDGWNRQAGVDANGDGDLTDSGDYRYSYDGLGRRITKFQDTANDGSNDAGNTEEFFFNESYQVVEVRKGVVASGTKTVDADPSERYLWDQAYIDAPAMVELDTNTDGTRDYRLWPTYDANFNVTALVSDAGVTVERYAYTPYGERIILNGDQNYANTAADADGTEFTVDTNGSDFAFLLGHQGLRLDAETGSYYNRARYLNSSLGVFGQRDPLATKYQDGMSLVQYLRGDPTSATDPTGLAQAGDTVTVDAYLPITNGVTASLTLTGTLLIDPYFPSVSLRVNPTTNKVETVVFASWRETVREDWQAVGPAVAKSWEGYHPLSAKCVRLDWLEQHYERVTATREAGVRVTISGTVVHNKAVAIAMGVLGVLPALKGLNAFGTKVMTEADGLLSTFTTAGGSAEWIGGKWMLSGVEEKDDLIRGSLKITPITPVKE